LTLTKAMEFVRAGIADDDLKLRVDGASRLVSLLQEADEILIMVGRAMNPAHQNPNLPRALGFKTQLIEALAEELRRGGKEIRVKYF
jgi:hypothetical protein